MDVVVTVDDDTINELSNWMNCLYLTGNLTKDDPARIFAGHVIAAIKRGQKEVSVKWADISNVNNGCAWGKNEKRSD